MRVFSMGVVACLLTGNSFAGRLRFVEPSLDRWMYVANSTPGSRAQASTFSALPSGGVDDRFAQFLISFDTTGLPTGLPSEMYQVTAVTLTATIGQDELFVFDPSYDSYNTFTGLVDEDDGRPLELHGVGYRGEFTSVTFEEDSPYGSSVRNAFALGFDQDGVQRDVTNSISDQFESQPWSIGQIRRPDTGSDGKVIRGANLQPGELVPRDAKVEFPLDLTLPGVKAYLQEGLSQGRLSLVLSSLHPATQQGGEFVSYYTKEDSDHVFFGGLAPQLELDVVVNAPRLELSWDGDDVLLNWDEVDGLNYRIYRSFDLTGGKWEFIAEASGGQWRIESPQGAAFYRLGVRGGVQQ